MNKIDELVPLIQELPDEEIHTAKRFLEFLIEKAHWKVNDIFKTLDTFPKVRKKIRLQGFLSGSLVKRYLRKFLHIHAGAFLIFSRAELT